jgi:RNA polymerase sigma factor (sigma-70 family)
MIDMSSNFFRYNCRVVREGQFPSTRRSILDLVQASDEPLRQRALDAIVEAYWKPAYKYIRLRWKQGEEEAQELTQDFFASLLERDLLQRYDPSAASFRTYLRTCIDGHVKNVWTAQRRAKRGGGARMMSLDFTGAEAEFRLVAGNTPVEELFHREWQRQMFSLAVDDLRRACLGTEREIRFRIFEKYDLAQESRPSYEDLSREWQVPVTAVTNHLAWARRELRRCVLDRLEAITASRAELHREAEGLLGPE